MPDPQKDVEVPENIGMNFTARDLQPYMGQDAKKLVQNELLGPQHYQMGVVPKHLSRAAKGAATSGAGNALIGGGRAAGAAYETGVKMLTDPARPDRIVTKSQKVRDLLEEAGKEELSRKENLEALGKSVGEFGGVVSTMSSAAAPLFDTYREYRYPSSQAAETAAKRVAKAKRKKERRSSEGRAVTSQMYDRFVRPFKEDARISKQIGSQMDKGGPIQLNAPPQDKN